MAIVVTLNEPETRSIDIAGVIQAFGATNKRIA
jgi:hypothetical protein